MVDVIYSVVYAVIGLGILIIIHEMGHFLVAKASGVQVQTFSVGFGPKIWGKKIGTTEYMLSAFPLGGYVKMLGEDPEEEVTETQAQQSFSHQSLLKRGAIVAAGPLSNLLLAVVIFTVVFLAMGIPTLSTHVGDLDPTLPAAKSGLQKGDEVLRVNGVSIKEWQDLSDSIKESGGTPLKLSVRRNQKELEFTVQPVKKEAKNIFGEQIENWVIGIVSEIVIEKVPPWKALGQSFHRTWEYSVLTLTAFVKMITGEGSPKNLGGPLMIAQIAGQQAQEGFIQFFSFVAVFSINLGILNLLPIPVLDGGHLLFFSLEALLGRPLAVKQRERAQQVGIFILILVMIYAFFNDITRFFQGPF